MAWDNENKSLIHTSAHPGKPLEILHASSMPPLSIGGWNGEDLWKVDGPGICHVSRNGGFCQLTIPSSVNWQRAVHGFVLW
jgi:hypothetical protein